MQTVLDLFRLQGKPFAAMSSICNCRRRSKKSKLNFEATGYEVCPMSGRADGVCPVTAAKQRGLASMRKDEGNALFKAGDYEAAVLKYTDSVRMAPDMPVYWLNRGKAYLKIHQTQMELWKESLIGGKGGSDRMDSPPAGPVFEENSSSSPLGALTDKIGLGSLSGKIGSLSGSLSGKLSGSLSESLAAVAQSVPEMLSLSQKCKKPDPSVLARARHDVGCAIKLEEENPKGHWALAWVCIEEGRSDNALVGIQRFLDGTDPTEEVPRRVQHTALLQLEDELLVKLGRKKEPVSSESDTDRRGGEGGGGSGGGGGSIIPKKAARKNLPTSEKKKKKAETAAASGKKKQLAEALGGLGENRLRAVGEAAKKAPPRYQPRCLEQKEKFELYVEERRKMKEQAWNHVLNGAPKSSLRKEDDKKLEEIKAEVEAEEKEKREAEKKLEAEKKQEEEEKKQEEEKNKEEGRDQSSSKADVPSNEDGHLLKADDGEDILSEAYIAEKKTDESSTEKKTCEESSEKAEAEKKAQEVIAARQKIMADLMSPEDDGKKDIEELLAEKSRQEQEGKPEKKLPAQQEKPFGDYSEQQEANLTLKTAHKYMPHKPKDIVLPSDYRKPMGVIPAETMKFWSGLNPENKENRLLLCCHGDIFDVSDRPDKYGKDGPYECFAGHDITHGLDCGDDSPENCNKFYDLYKGEDASTSILGICGWLYHFHREYGDPVGRLEEYEDEGYHLPVPPETKMEGACSIM